MKYLDRIAGPAYAIALILILFPIMDLALNTWPAQLGEVAWRYGAATLISRMAMTPLLGLLFAYGAAVLLEQPRTLRILSVLNSLISIFLVVGVVVFLLDALQMRVQVAADAKTRYDMGTLIALAKFGFGFLILLFFTISEWKAASNMAKGTKQARSDPKASIVQPSTRTQSPSGGNPIVK